MTSRPPWRFQLALALVVVVLGLAQSPGLLTFDTKLDLLEDPGGFLERALTLWNAESTFGELQNQASGYLFPIGPFFLAGHALGLPMWIWERLWTALLMLLAYEGARRVAAHWGGLSTRATVLAGLAYMLAPRMLSTVGALTGEALPTSILPWTLLPLVAALRGRLSPGRAALISAATIPFMGGQNATEVLATLTLPACLIVFNGLPLRLRARLFATWTALAVLVSLWWIYPLLLLGRYGSPFLGYIESARTTTDLIGWLSALRGADHWVTFIARGDRSGWETGFILASSPGLLITTCLVGVIGLLGLGAPRLRNKGALVAAATIALFALTAGSGLWSGSVLDGVWSDALDGALAPFRNVHKFDPVLRLVLALGLAAAADQVADRCAARTPRDWQRWLAPAVAVLIAAPILGAAAPMFQSRLRDDSGFSALPGHWRDAARFLDRTEETVRALVVPGAGFATQTWGRTVDEPLQVLDSGQWSTRNQTPLFPPGTIRYLDAIESILVAGRPDPTLVPTLARAGVTHLVVRNDLDHSRVDAPRPELVHRVLDGLPGLLKVANFGKSETIYPAVEVYVVDSRHDPRVRLFAADDAVTVSGGAEALPQLIGAQVLDPKRAMLRSGATGPDDPPSVVTDSMQRIERNFGRVHEATSQVMTEEDTFRNIRAAHDYDYDDEPATVTKYAGISQVTASSSVGYADAAGEILPEQGPFAAVDGSVLTSWTTAPFQDPLGSWIELRFDKPTVLGAITAQFDIENGAAVRRIAVDTDSQHRVGLADLDGLVEGLGIETAPTTRLRLTVEAANRSIRPVRLNEITIDGVPVGRAFAVPGAAGAATSMSFQSEVQRPACTPFFGGLNCGSDYQRLTVDGTGWARSVEVEQDASWLVAGTVVPRQGQDVAALLAPLDPRQVSVSASSWFGGDVAAAPQNAFDGEGATAWIAAASDERPVLDLSWKKPRTLSRITARLAPGIRAKLPSELTITTADGVRRVGVGELQTGTFAPVRTNFLRIKMSTRGASTSELPFGISELEIPGLEDSAYHARSKLPTGAVCGLGPTITIGAKEYLTKVSGTIGDVVSGRPLRLEGCDLAGLGINVRAGTRTIAVHNTGAFAVKDLAFTPSLPERAKGVPGTAEVASWTATSRVVDVSVDEDSLLAITQSTNPGWVATLNGRQLESVEVDGWMQGWRLPAGSEGKVRLGFTPQTGYSAGLIGGLLVAAALMIAGVVALVRRRRSVVTAIEERDAWRRVGVGLFWVALAVLSLPALAGGLVAQLLRRRGAALGALLVAGALAAATIIGYRGITDSLAAPESANLLVAVAVGAVLTRALTGRPRS